MPIPVEHRISIKKTKNEPEQWRTACSCQWEGICSTERMAIYFSKCHQQAQLIRGNTVIIEEDGKSRPDASPEAAGTETPSQPESTPAPKARARRKTVNAG